MSETQALRDDAGRRFEDAVGFAFEDAEQRRLRYHLLRLTVAGLGHDEIRPLVERFAKLFGHDAQALMAGPFTVVTPEGHNPYQQMYVAN